MALSQEDTCVRWWAMITRCGTAAGYFTRTRRSNTEEGGEILKGKRDLVRPKKLLAESGYSGQPVTCVVAQDQPITKAQGDVTADLLKQMG